VTNPCGGAESGRVSVDLPVGMLQTDRRETGAGPTHRDGLIRSLPDPWEVYRTLTPLSA
jgi:hypothetical protein